MLRCILLSTFASRLIVCYSITSPVLFVIAVIRAFKRIWDSWKDYKKNKWICSPTITTLIAVCDCGRVMRQTGLRSVG